MSNKETILTQEQKAAQIANDLIKSIMDGVIKKDILMNTALDFSGDGEVKFIEKFRNYLRSASYVLDKKVRI